jgi:hypothetical protein
MIPVFLYFAKYIKHESFNRVINILMIQEHSTHITQIFTINYLIISIYFKKSNVFISIDLITRWESSFTFYRVSKKLFFVNTKEKTKVADIKALTVIFFRESCEIPGFKPMDTKLNTLDCFNPRLLYKLLHIPCRHSTVFIIE